jgi:hypothetical protein
MEASAAPPYGPLEIIGYYNGESIAVDTEGNLLALGTMRVIGRV